MANVSMNATIPASAAEVWKIISDFNGLPKFVAAIVNSTMEGSGIGAVRTLTLGDGAQIVEKLEALDEKAQSLNYSIVNSPLPLENYLATVQVKDLGGNQCEIVWSSTFDPKGAPEAEAKKVVEGVYSLGFDGLKKMYGG